MCPHVPEEIAITSDPREILHIPQESSKLLINYSINHYIRTIVQVCNIFYNISKLLLLFLLPIYAILLCNYTSNYTFTYTFTNLHFLDTKQQS